MFSSGDVESFKIKILKMKRRKNGKIDEKNNEWRFYFAPKSQNGKNEFYFKIRERCELKQSLIL